VPVPSVTATRDRADRCPGVTRPWPAEDGSLVRIRVVGGTLPASALASLVDLAGRFGDGDLHLTRRANLQVRALANPVPDGFVAGVRAAGLLPSPSHELVRNVMLSPLSGRLGGRADLRPVVPGLDRLLLADPSFARLPGRFLFVLDDGRGDLVGRTSDLAAVALDADAVQLRAGDVWGPVLPIDETANALVSLTNLFLRTRGEGPAAPWHVAELDAPLLAPHDRDPRVRETGGRPPYGPAEQVDGRTVEHVEVPEGRLTPALAAEVLARAGAEIVVTPWRSLLLPDLEDR
jgi:precorrin-3B synthase